MSSGALVRIDGLQELLDRCQRRIRVHALLRGVAETMCVLIGAVVLGCALDYMIALPGVLRLAILGGTIVLTCAVAWKRLIHPVFASAPAEELGAAVDLRFPELQESLATLISVEDDHASAGESGSLLMRQRLQQHVESQIRGIRPSAVVRSRTAVKRCGMAMLCVIAVMIPVVLWPTGSGLLMKRFLLPFANLAAPSNLYFEIPEGNRTVATNSDVTFAAIPQWRTGAAGRLPDNVLMEIEGALGESEHLQMSFDETQAQYSATLTDARQSIRYRVRGGGAVTEWFQLTVADPPRILSAVLQETPPAYTGRPVEVFDGAVGEIHVFERSVIEISLTFNKPVQQVRMDWKNWQPLDSSVPVLNQEEMDAGENQDPQAAAMSKAAVAVEPPSDPPVLSPDGMAASFRFDALGSGQFEFHVEDSLGLQNSGETVRRLIVTTDTPPVLEVTGLRDDMEVRPDDIVPLNCGVVDDIGVGLLELHVRKNAEATRIQPADPFERGAMSVRHEFRVDLAKLNVREGDFVTFRVRAADERPVPEPQVVWKGPWTIRIREDAEPLGQKPLREADQQLIESLRELEAQLQQDVQKADALKEQARQQWNEQTQQAVRELSEKEQTQGRDLQQIAQQVAEHPLMQKQSDKLNELAQQIRQNVPAKLAEAADANRDAAGQKIQESANDLNQIREALRATTDEIEKVAQLEQELAELNRLALEAQQVAQDAQQLQNDRQANQPEEGQSAAEHQDELQQRKQQLEQEQQQLSEDLDSLLQRKEELLQAAREAQLDDVAAVAEQARRLAQQEQQLAQGVDEAARDAARDVQELAENLRQAKNEAEQLGRQMQQQAQDVARPDVQPLDEAIRDLRQGNLASPQRDIEQFQQQLAQAAEKLNKPAEAQPAQSEAANAPAPNDAAQNADQQKLDGQNQERANLGEQAEQINERLEQLQGQLAEIAEELGAQPDEAPANAQNQQAGESQQNQAAGQPNAEPANPEQGSPEQGNQNQGNPERSGPERANQNPAAESEAAQDENAASQAQPRRSAQTQNAGEQRNAEQPENGEQQQNAGQQQAGQPEQGQNSASVQEQSERRPQPGNEQNGDPRQEARSADIARSMLEQLAQMTEAAQEQADAISADPRSNLGARQSAQQAAQRADDAMRHAQAGQFNRAAEQMRNTAAQSGRAAESLNDESQQDRRAQLQQQQDSFGRMADTVQRLQQDNAAQVAAQQDSQREVAQAAEQLTEEFAEMAERLNLPTLGMQAQARSAQEAAEAAQQAAQSGSQASQQLNQTQLQQAGQSAQEAAGQLNRAAQLAQQASQGRRDPNAIIPTEVGESVTDALQSLQRASQMMNPDGAQHNGQPGQQGQDSQQAPQPGEQGQPGEGQTGQPGNSSQQSGNQPGQQPEQGQQGEGQPGQGQPGQGQPGQGQPGQGQPGQGQPGSPNGQPQNSSAQQLANAARALQNAARQALPNQFSPGQLNPDGSEGTSDPRGQGNPAEFDGRDPNATTRKGNARAWGQLQDELGGNVGDAGKEVLDSEYSELIRRYRRDLARSGNQPPQKKSGKAK